MNIIKIWILAASLTVIGLNGHVLKEKQIRSYLVQSIDYWFFPNNNHPSLMPLVDTIEETILTHPSYYAWDYSSYSYQNYYELEYVEQVLRGAIIDAIKAHTYSSARIYVSRMKAELLSQWMYTELINYCAKTSQLPAGIFSSYIGDDLHILISDKLKTCPMCHTFIDKEILKKSLEDNRWHNCQ